MVFPSVLRHFSYYGITNPTTTTTITLTRTELEFGSFQFALLAVSAGLILRRMCYAVGIELLKQCMYARRCGKFRIVEESHDVLDAGLLNCQRCAVQHAYIVMQIHRRLSHACSAEMSISTHLLEEILEEAHLA